jgi:hypothetical protein
MSEARGGFQYLALRITHGASTAPGIRAEVRNSGNFNLGTENSRNANSPFAVFQIEEFTGLECIKTDDLLNELRNRLTADEIMHRLSHTIPTDTLLAMLRERTES